MVDWKKVLGKGFQYPNTYSRIEIELETEIVFIFALDSEGRSEGGGFNARLEALPKLSRKVHRGMVLGFVKISQGKRQKPRQLLTADIFFTMASAVLTWSGTH